MCLSTLCHLVFLKYELVVIHSQFCVVYSQTLLDVTTSFTVKHILHVFLQSASVAVSNITETFLYEFVEMNQCFLIATI